MAVGLAGLGLAGSALSGCASGRAGSLVGQACRHVATAEHLQAQSNEATDGTARRLAMNAELQLELAEPLAAQAAGEDPSWDALQATLQQAGSGNTETLLPALKAECASPEGEG